MPKRKRSASSATRRKSKRRVFTVRKRKRVKKLAKSVVVSMMEKKLKMWAQSFASVNPVGTASVIDLTNIAIGDNSNQREGARITLRSLRIRTHLVNNTTNTSGSQLFRFVVFQWHPNLAFGAPTVTEILQTPTAGNGMVSPMVVQKAERKTFSVLLDRTINLKMRPPTATFFPVESRLTHFFPRVRNKRIYYGGEGSGGTTGSNHIWMMWFTNQSSVPGQLAYHITLRYTDA